MSLIKLQLAAILICGACMPMETCGIEVGKEMPSLETPKFLYKVVSVQDWEKTQSQKQVPLSKDDTPFIHLSREDQLEKITSKYWTGVSKYLILKLDVSKLKGRLALEANPGGENKYYHLYEGVIPLQSVLEAKVKD